MYAIDRSSLEAQRQRPLLQRRSIAGASAAKFLESAWEYHGKAKQISIGETAVIFYLLNHGASLVNQAAIGKGELTPLQADFYGAYHKEAGAIGVRMAHDITFMLLAMASFCHPDEFHYELIESDEAMGGPKAAELMREICGRDKNNTWWTPNFAQSGQGLRKAASAADPALTVGELIRALTLIVDVRQAELAYGPLWRDVGRMFGQWAEGGKSLEALIDTSFTYCHCNGSFFEKGHLFQAVGNDLFNVLDVQRSGQIPQYVHEGRSRMVTAKAKALAKRFAAIDPSVFEGKVKWSDVKAVSRDELVFTQKYAKAWNARWGAGGAAAAAAAPPKPKIFDPIGEDGYRDMVDIIGKGVFR